MIVFSTWSNLAVPFQPITDDYLDSEFECLLFIVHKLCFMEFLVIIANLNTAIQCQYITSQRNTIGNKICEKLISSVAF